MKIVKFPMYFKVCVYQTMVLPDYVDANDEDAVKEFIVDNWEHIRYQTMVLPDYVDTNDEDAVKEFIADNWEHIRLPDDYDYVGDAGFDFEAQIEITEE